MYTNNWVYIETNEKQLNGFERYSYGSSKSWSNQIYTMHWRIL